MEQKGQYIGWVEEVVILGPTPTHGLKLGNIKEHQSYKSLGLIVDPK